MGGQLVGDGPHGVVALGRDVADVYGQDPAGVAQHDLVVDLRVAIGHRDPRPLILDGDHRVNAILGQRQSRTRPPRVPRARSERLPPR